MMAISYYAPIVFQGVWGGGIGGMLLYEHWHRTRERKRLIEQPTLKTIPAIPTLPVVIPAASLDASDTTPMPEQTNAYCPACWLEWIGKPWRAYFAPEGTAAFCERHAYMTLARALSAQQQQRETGDKYL